MKHFKRLLFCLLIAPLSIFAQCAFTSTFTTPSSGLAFNNIGHACSSWQVNVIVPPTVTTYMLRIEGAPDNAGSPGTFSLIPVQTATPQGAGNPDIYVGTSFIVLSSNPQWLRFTLVNITGSGTITAAASGQLFTNTVISTIDATKFGLIADGITSDSTALQSAIDAARGSTMKQVRVPNGPIRLTNTINLTSDGFTIYRDNISIVGANSSVGFPGGTQFINDVGPGKPAFDLSGSQHIELSEFSILPGFNTPGTIGVFMSRASTRPACENIDLHNLYIQVGSNPSANGGNGTLGVWNYGCEINHYHDNNIRANMPVTLTQVQSPVTLPAPGPTSYFITTTTAVSLGATVIDGSNEFIAYDFVAPVVFLDNVSNIKISAYMQCGTSPYNIAPGTWTFATEWLSTEVLSFDGLTEGCPQWLRAYRTNTAVKVNIENLSSTSLSPVDITPINSMTDGTTFLNSSLNINTPSLSSTVPTVSTTSTPANGSLAIGLHNVDIHSSNTLFPSYLAWSSTNVKLFADSGEKVEYGTNQITKQIAPIDATSGATVLTINLPNPVTTANGAGMTVKLEGTLTTGSAYNQIQPSSAFVSITFSGSIDPGAYAITFSTPQVTLGTAANVSSPGNNITACTATVTYNSTPQTATIVLTPTNTGGDVRDVWFNGTATLYWQGSLSTAPTL